MKKIIYLVSITWIMLLSSCSDVLDITPTDRYPDPAVWQDENLLKMFVNEQYSGICTKDNYYKIMYFGDDIFSKYNEGGCDLIRENILTADNVGSLNNILHVWDNSYKFIHNINVFFNNIGESSIDDSVKKELIAEMKFIRAYIYAKLIWAYGGVTFIEEAFDIKSD